MLWFNGQLQSDTTVPFDVADRGLLLGDGAFDTALVLGGRMVFRAAHIARLSASCRTLGFVLDEATVDRAIHALLATAESGSLRITVTRGPGPRGVAPLGKARPTIMAFMAPPATAALFAPVKLAIANARRNESSPTTQMKTLQYLDAVLASRDAIRDGFDDALFLNTKGDVACTSVGNVFALIGNQLVTPHREDGIIPGIVRATLLESCGSLGLVPIERSLTRTELCLADQIFVTNSLKLVSPVTTIDKVRNGGRADRRLDRLITHLCELIHADCGVDPRSMHAQRALRQSS
jgi:branched-chain amino acid aminotransferase